MNKNGTWLNGVKVDPQTITTEYTFTTNMFLMALNAVGTPGSFLLDGHVAAVCIVNATDPNETVEYRSSEMGKLIS